MTLSEETLRELCDIACDAASRAGRVISDASSQSIEVLEKDAGDTLASQVVTEADHRCDELIRECLSPVSGKLDFALLTEEVEDDGERLRKDFFWCVDPLDGTLAFTQGKPGYAVSIALVAKDSTPMIGVVYDPVEEKMYSAVQDQGALVNGAPWLLSLNKSSDMSSDISSNVSSPDSDFLTVPIDDGLQKRDDFSSIMNSLENWAKQNGLAGMDIRRHAGAVMSAIWVAENPQGCYFKLPKPKVGGGSSWDFAATACIYKELGLQVSDFAGNPLDLNRADSTYMNHSGVTMATREDLIAVIQSVS